MLFSTMLVYGVPSKDMLVSTNVQLYQFQKVKVLRVLILAVTVV